LSRTNRRAISIHIRAGSVESVAVVEQGRSKTVIMVTHDPKAAAFGSRSIHLEKGELLDDAPKSFL